MMAIARLALMSGLAAFAIAGCISKDEAKKLVEAFESRRPSRPDGMPVMLNRQMPVKYPPSLYARRAQGNVTLRLLIDSTGAVHPESTRVVEPSGEPAFDSAAVAGAAQLRFTPATRHGTPVAVAVLFPVYFRHPEGAPMPGDSILHRGADSGGQVTGAGPVRAVAPDSGGGDQATKSAQPHRVEK
jgi:TonB family protein